MRKNDDSALPPLTPEEIDRLNRGQEDSFWTERHDRRQELEGRWNFIRSRRPPREGVQPKCEHKTVDERECTYRRAEGATSYRARLPHYCRFHLLVDHAVSLAVLLRGDPEAITQDFAVGCIGLLVEERSRGGPTAVEAQAALVAICDALLEWRGAEQR